MLNPDTATVTPTVNSHWRLTREPATPLTQGEKYALNWTLVQIALAQMSSNLALNDKCADMVRKQSRKLLQQSIMHAQ